MLDSLHILIVDDRPDGVLFLSEFLHSRNHLVEISNDGQEALEAILRRHRTHDAYDLVFSSLTMARLDGLALLRNLRRRGVDVPTALYAATGALTPEISQQAKVHGCLAILEKPLSLQRIERLLDDLMHRRSGNSRIHTPAPGTASHRRSDDKPFFGTSRVRHGDAPDIAPPLQVDPPTTPAQGRIRRPSSGELQPAPMMPPNVDLPAIPPVGHSALTPTGLRLLPPSPGSGTPPPPPAVPPVAPPSTGFLGPRPTETRSSTRREESSGYNQIPEPTTRPPTNTYTRRHSGLFTPPPHRALPPGQPSATTARIRRTISGVQQPVMATPPTDPLRPPPAPASYPVSCAHCRQVFLVVAKPQSYTVVCVHCGQLNRIDPM